MSPALLAAILTGVEEAIKLTPSLVAELQTLFSKGQPTADDWAALKARVVAKSYEDYVPQTSIPKGT